MDRSVPSAAWPALLAEIRKNRAAQVHRLLELDKEKCVRMVDLIGWTPLHHAAYLGHAKVAEVLLNHGAEINARDRDGLTPLHLSVANGNVKAVSLLLKQGADPYVADRFGRLPIDVSVDKTRDLLPARGLGLNGSASATYNRFSTSGSLSYSSPLSQSGYVSRDAWSSSPLGRPNFSKEAGHYEEEYADEDDYGIYEEEYDGVEPLEQGARLSDSDDASSSLSGGPHGVSQGSEKSSLKANAMKIWLKAKQVAKWQIMSIAVRILLCYLLELFVDHFKRVLYFVIQTYTPYDIIVLLFHPLRMMLSPIWPLLGPYIIPVFDFMASIIIPVVEYLKPAFLVLWAVFEPIFSMFYQLGWFIVDKLQYFVVPLQRAIWDPLIRIASTLYSVFGPGFEWLYQTFLAPFLGIIFRIFIALFTPFYEIARLFVQKFAGNLLQPIWLILQRIGIGLMQFLASNYQKIMGNIWAAIQPMLNIRGFFARVFGPLITGLKAILHWFVPESVIRQIDRITFAIFGRDDKKEQEYATEETALIFVLILILLLEVAVVVFGYFAKLVIFVLSFYDGDLSTRIYTLLSFFSDDESDNIPASFSWILPDFIHHELGVSPILMGIALVLVYRLALFLVWLVPIVARFTWNFIKNFSWRRPFAIFSSSAPAVAPVSAPQPTSMSPPRALSHSLGSPAVTNTPSTTVKSPGTPKRGSTPLTPTRPARQWASPDAIPARRQLEIEPNVNSQHVLAKSVPASPAIRNRFPLQNRPSPTSPVTSGPFSPLY